MIEIAERLSPRTGFTAHRRIKEGGEHATGDPLIKGHAIVDHDARPQIIDHAGDDEDKKRNQRQAEQGRLTLTGQDAAVDLKRVKRQGKVEEVRDKTEAKGDRRRLVAIAQSAAKHIVRQVCQEGQEFHLVQSVSSEPPSAQYTIPKEKG